MKLHRMSVQEALNFYQPVEGALKKKLAPSIASKAKVELERKFDFPLSSKAEEVLVETIGKEYAYDQFEQIIEFMSGYRSTDIDKENLEDPGRVKCFILIYEGKDACKKIREVLGPTDPSKAPEGTVRRDFGRNIMVNTAHASDSPENAKKEMVIVKAERNRCSYFINEYLKTNK